jgi:hypothetical protein
MAMQPADPEAMQLYQIIGAPLLAVVQAEVQAAQVSADFIRRVGFESPTSPRSAAPTPEGTAAPAQNAGTAGPASPPRSGDQLLQDGGPMGDLRMAEFRIDRTDAFGKIQPHVVRVPVLSLYPIPLLQVKHAEFEYNIRILSRVPLQSPDGEDAETGFTPSQDYLSPDRVELKGLLGPATGKGESVSSMSMRVKIQMEQSDIPIGLSKLMTVMDQNVTARPVPAPKIPEADE